MLSGARFSEEADTAPRTLVQRLHHVESCCDREVVSPPEASRNVATPDYYYAILHNLPQRGSDDFVALQNTRSISMISMRLRSAAVTLSVAATSVAASLVEAPPHADSS